MGKPLILCASVSLQEDSFPPVATDGCVWAQSRYPGTVRCCPGCLGGMEAIETFLAVLWLPSCPETTLMGRASLTPMREAGFWRPMTLALGAHSFPRLKHPAFQVFLALSPSHFLPVPVGVPGPQPGCQRPIEKVCYLQEHLCPQNQKQCASRTHRRL